MKRSVLLLLPVMALAACDVLKHATEPTTTTPVNQVDYTAVGASDTTGYGGTIPCVPFTDCPNGTGYVPGVVRRLQAAGKTVTLMNLGIPGAVLSPDIQSIGNSLGRGIFGNFLDSELPFVPHNTTVVTVFAGGNDVNTIGAALENGLGGVTPATYLQTQATNFGRDLRALVSGIKTRAPQARIVFLNLPNMAGLPYASGDTLVRKQMLQQIAVAFSGQINALTSQGVLVIDLMCDARFYQPGSYSSDGFHPNDTGYAYLTELIYPVASTGTASAPRASCAQMTIF